MHLYAVSCVTFLLHSLRIVCLPSYPSYSKEYLHAFYLFGCFFKYILQSKSKKGNFTLSRISNPDGIDLYGDLQLRDGDDPSLGNEFACKTGEYDKRTFSILPRSPYCDTRY